MACSRTKRGVRKVGDIMAKMNMIASLNSALKHQLERDKNVVIFGEDVGYFGGVFRVTAGLQNEFGRSQSI